MVNTAKIAKSPVALKTRIARLFSFYGIIQLVALYAVFSPYFGMQIYNHLLFFPSAGENFDLNNVFEKIDSTTNSRFSKVTIPSGNNEKLDAWFFKKENAKKLFIVSHGNGGNIAYRIPLIPVLLFAGGSVLLYDYEGYGFSTGEPSIPALKRDGLAVYDYAREQLHYEPKDIIVYGESLGSGVTTYIAQNRTVGGIVIQSGFSSLVRAAQDRLLILRLYPLVAFQNVDLDNKGYLQGKHPPLLWLHGDKDETLPVYHADDTIAAASEPKTLVKFSGAGHNNVSTINPKFFATTVGNFLQNLP